MSVRLGGSYNSQPKVVLRFLSVVATTFGFVVRGGQVAPHRASPGRARLDPAAALPLFALQPGGSGTPTRSSLDALERIHATTVRQLVTSPPAPQPRTSRRQTSASSPHLKLRRPAARIPEQDGRRGTTKEQHPMTDTTEATTTDKRAEFIAGLRAMADHYEQTTQTLPYSTVSVNVIENDPARFADETRILGGDRTKHGTDDLFRVRRQFGPIRLDIIATRSKVCEAVKVGTETYVEHEVVETRQVTKTRDLIRWDCKPVLDAEQVPA